MRILLSWILLSTICLAQTTDEERAEIVQKMLDESTYLLRNWESEEKRYTEVLPEMFGGMPDDELTRHLAAWLFVKTGMHPFACMKLTSLLRAAPDVLTDSTELRRLLRNETDPRRFSLLCSLAGYFRGTHGEIFVNERVHMLFRKGKVAEGFGEYRSRNFLDVSRGAYNGIVMDLRFAKADFDAPDSPLEPDDEVHEKRKIALAKWLKANWPGCENLEIPRHLLGEESRPRKALAQKEKLSSSPKKDRAQKASQVAESQNEQNRVPWIVAGLLLLGFLVLLLKICKGKPTT